ncbi:FUSC family membrane protein [Spirosoma sp. KNUC1025]|uniref:FUSC family membrane protein n=1 Tax=Spirosoma sp. KNUC1025 TaxID=2894082 RepID=UPI00386C626F|nr:FUSC family protein [Spirosoma sp. KNUC1025]
MNKRARQVSYFLSSQYFSDGLRTTLSILLPALALMQFGQLQAGLAMSLGALNVSISDAPGPVAHRRNGMAASVLLCGLVTLITGFARMNPYVLGLEITLFGFFFSMFGVYGNRATTVGTAALLIMILMLDRPLDATGVLHETALVIAGGSWYMAISLLASQLQPYRLAQQALGQCIHEMAKLMAIKADFYRVSTDLDDDYRRLIAQQVVVSEKQDAVREVLFKSRRIVNESTSTGRLLVLTFTDVVDLYEQITAMYYDYSSIRERFGRTGVLNTVAKLIRRLSVELDHIGLAIQSPVRFHRPVDINPTLAELKQTIDALSDQEGSTLVLKKVLVSLRAVSQRVTTLQNNLSKPDRSPVRTDDIEYGRFISHQIIDVESFKDNLTLNSSAFRHAARVSIAMLVGYVVTMLLSYGHHSYWVLLTITVIMKPAFSLTKQRNIERIIGTLAGGLIGVLILTFVPNKTAQFGFMVFFMLGTYSAQRTYYMVMVICVTPFVLILFSFLGVSYLGVVEERFFDTLLGGVIAFIASYLLFPQWESDQLIKPMQAVLQANVRYLQLLLDSLSGRAIDIEEYKLARKDVYVTSANMGAVFDRMMSEPKHKQRNERLIYQFVVLNHILSANIATITSDRISSEPKPCSASFIRPVKRALFTLTESLRRLGVSSMKPAPELPAADSKGITSPTDDRSVGEQLAFIQQVSSDISKCVERIKPHAKSVTES